MARQLLVDSFSFVPLTMLTEDQAGSKYVFEGIFGHVDKPTSNGRIYTEALMQREINRLEQKMYAGKVFGELDHPDDGKTKLQRCAVLVQSLRIDENGKVIGKMKIMETSMGKELMAIVDAGGQIGVSSRGYGSVQTNEDGFNVVQEDFKLMTYDPVADPAEESAYPNVTKVESKSPVGESASVDNVSPKKNEKSSGADEEDDAKDDTTDYAKDAVKGNVSTNEAEDPDEEPEDDEIKDKNGDGQDDSKQAKILLSKAKKAKEEAAEIHRMMINAALSEQKKEFQANLLIAIKEAKDEMRSQLVEEMAGDPQMGGAKAALDQIKKLVRPFVVSEDSAALVEERDRKIVALTEQVAVKDNEVYEAKRMAMQMTLAAKEMGYNLFLERNLANHPKFDRIVESLGDFSKIGTLGDLKKKIAPYAEQARDISEVKSELIDELQEKNAILEEKFEASKIELTSVLKENLQNAARVYLENQIVGNPHQVEIREEFEALDRKTKQGVDRLVKRSRTRRKNENRDFSSIRQRIERQNGGFRRPDNIVEDHVIETFPEDHDGNKSLSIMGESFDMNLVNKLAGI